MIDEQAPRYGLPASLLVPIAAADVAAIERFVGIVEHAKTSRSGEATALAVRTHPREEPSPDAAPLWSHPQADELGRRLFPPLQIWVHVDYRAYRQAYLSLGGPPIPEGYFLDHVQNRVAARLRWYAHPYVRLCPVSRTVNTSGGHAAGGEGMEKDHLRELRRDPARAAALEARLRSQRVVYADPMDLTKMLDRAPGTHILDGVRETQRLFFPR